MKPLFQKWMYLSFCLLLSQALTGEQRLVPAHVSSFLSERLNSNGINDILIAQDTVWIGGGKGLSYTRDQGETWFHFERSDGFGKGGLSALVKRGALMWVATAFDTVTESSGELPAGGGLSYSTDGGETWAWIPQPVDSRDETDYKPTTTHIQNLTYDIAISEDYVWITSFGGGLRRSPIEANGAEWEVVTVNGEPFSSLDYLSHRTFSTLYDGEAIWVGSADGVHKSLDEGESWISFNHLNQAEGLSGNFVVALGLQQTDQDQIIWAASVEALGETETRAVSRTEDGGLTWDVVLEGVFAHNFAFDDSVVYVASDQGLYKSINLGETWALYPHYIDEEQGWRIYTTAVNTAAVDEAGGLWVGTSDGLAYTQDELTWHIFKAWQPAGQGGEPETYAFPNPFSPLRHNQVGDDGFVRFQYHLDASATVTVRVYDFAMKCVTTVAENKFRPFAGDFSEAWDGRNDFSDMVANGVYFYRIDISEREPLWGKVMVVN